MNAPWYQVPPCLICIQWVYEDLGDYSVLLGGRGKLGPYDCLQLFCTILLPVTSQTYTVMIEKRICPIQVAAVGSQICGRIGRRYKVHEVK